MAKYIWQNKEWPELFWDNDRLIEALGRARKHQGRILAQFENFELKSISEFVVEDAVNTAAIEGEIYDPNTVRSSVARRLGLPTAGLPPEQQKIDGLVEILLDATMNYETKLTAARLKGWHAALFPTGHSGIHKITVGGWRTGTEPMKVISGSIGKEKTHFEAPTSKDVTAEMKKFFEWWKKPTKPMDGLIRAGVAHFWFITIHPFDDGNGRIARAITDLALAQDEKTGLRLYSLSNQISKNRNRYYKELEKSQKGVCDITDWLLFFLEIFEAALTSAHETLLRVKTMNSIWEKVESQKLNQRQSKVMTKLLEAEPKGFEGGLTNKKYVAMTKTTTETAKRDLADLVKKELLRRNPGGGRSVSYSLKI